MAIQSASELEAVVARAIIKLEKHIAERGTWPVLEDQRRVFEQIKKLARDGAKLKALREKLRAASESVGSEVPTDNSLLEDLWDIEDYVDYRA